jgi:death on curing protein
MASSFQFLNLQEVIAFHSAIIEASGGSQGIRDEGGLESALNAAQQRAHYEHASLAICAATYAYHLTTAHAFVDGNKRVGAGVAFLFIRLNGGSYHASEDEWHDLFMGIAAAIITRDQTEAFFTERVIPPA